MASEYLTVWHDHGRDEVAIEEPLEIRVDGEALAVTMRTPGHDDDLALGFLFGEGLIDGSRRVDLTGDLAANTVEVAGPLVREPGDRRVLYDLLVRRLRQGRARGGRGVQRSGTARSQRAAFARRRTTRPPQPAYVRAHGWLARNRSVRLEGSLLCVREDVGRHNAMDKVIGWALLEGAVPLAERILCVSDRLSFELVQKAAVAGAPLLVGVGAPSSLAIELAEDRAVTLCGFARGDRVNVYTRPERIAT